MSGVTWFITGASRGIGLETTRQLLLNPANTVFATCRSPSTATDLKGLKDTAKGTLHVVQLDVADAESIKSGTSAVLAILEKEGRGLDYVLNNAAINVGNDLALNFDPEDLLKTITSNIIGPSLITRALVPAIEKSQRKVIMNMTSGLASIASDHGDKCATYSISKTGVNMLTYKMAKERPDFIPLVVDPGWVKTEMGGEGAQLEPHESVAGILSVLTKATPESAGGFFGYKGNRIPW